MTDEQIIEAAKLIEIEKRLSDATRFDPKQLVLCVRDKPDAPPFSYVFISDLGEGALGALIARHEVRLKELTGR